MAPIWEAMSALAALPQAANSLLQLWKSLSPGISPANASVGAEESQVRLLEAALKAQQQRCLDREAEVRSDIRIPSEHQRDRILQLFAGIRGMIRQTLEEDPGLHQLLNSTGSADKMLQIISKFCELAEDAWHQAMQSGTSYSLPSDSADNEIGKIKERLRRNQPFVGSRASDIYSSTERPPSIEFTVCAGRSPLVTLNSLQCFMEYFPFGSDLGKAKSRICWMMLLLQKLRCPHVMEPVKVFSIAEGSQPGFYTCSRVPSYHQPAPATARELCTLDECVSTRVHMNRKKVVTHLSLAVEELHAQSILHKNICINNVVVDQNDNAWLAGLSSSRLDDQGSYKIPQEDLAKVKMVYYDSSDVSRHERTFKCDIYALGMVMLEVALGKSFVKSTEVTSKPDIFSLLHHRVQPGLFKTRILECLAPEARRRPLAKDISSALDAMSVQDIDCSQRMAS